MNEGMGAHAHGNDLYTICCIPAHCYGVHLGDVVLAPDAVVAAIVKKSPFRTVRIWFNEAADLKKRSEAINGIHAISPLIERISESLYAVAYREKDKLNVWNFLGEYHRQGFIETDDADSYPFGEVSGFKEDGSPFTAREKAVTLSLKLKAAMVKPFDFED